MSMTMEGLGAMAVGVLVLIVAFTIIPIVGDQLDTSVTLPAGNTTTQACDSGRGCLWNSSVNTDIPTGVDLWESIGGILKVAGIIVVVAGFMRTLQGIRQSS